MVMKNTARIMASLAVIVSLSAGCASGLRNEFPLEPLSKESIVSDEDRKAVFTSISDNLNKKLITPNNCDSTLEDVLAKITPITVMDSRISISDKPKEQVEYLWSFRQAVHNNLKDQKTAGKWPDSCLRTTKQILNKTRLYEDQVVERWQLKEGIEKNVPFQGTFPYVLKPEGAKWDDFASQLKTGDILMKRTVSFYAAVIAKMPVVNGEFSHLNMVYRHEDGKISVLEMDSKGLRSEALEDYIKPGINNSGWARISVLRFEDEKKAKDAAEWQFANRGKFQFDFFGDIEDNGEMYCAESICVAFEKVGVKEACPYLSDLGKLYNTSFVKQAGLKKQKIYLPDDIEVDHRFSYVGEWRDPSLFREMLYQNVIFEKVFDWMTEKGYEHVDGTEISFLTIMVKLSRDKFNLLEDKMDMDTPEQIIEWGIRYRELSNKLEAQMEDIDLGKNPLSANQLGLYLEQLREKDKKVYDHFTSNSFEENNQWPIFHDIFRPKEQ